MKNKRTDISQIEKYLNGELDAAAMHRLEREAQDDPFLMEALEGYESTAVSQQPHLADLENRLQQRIIEKPARKHIPWKYYAAAAAILVFLTLGYDAWIGKQQHQKLTASNLAVPVDHVVIKTDTTANMISDKRGLTAANVPLPKHIPVQPEIKPAAVPSQTIRTNDRAATVYKADTVEYKASDYKVRNNSPKLDELLKKMEGMEVNADGSVTHQGQAITKVKLNGKDYAGGDVQQAVKNLPANILEKAQVIDDYGDQASRAKIKTNKDTTALKEVTVAGYGALTKTDITGNAAVSQTLLGKVKGVNVTTPPRINGTVYDELGLALPGVSVLLNGTRNGVVTDDKGRFTIPAEGQAATLNVSYVGYQSKQVKASVNDSLQIKLQSSNVSLSEVVVTKNYGKTEKVITAARPRIGWDKYDKYLKKAALSDKNGTVNLSFRVNARGELSDIHATKGPTDIMKQQAIDLLKNGPAWYGDSSDEAKTVKLKIRFKAPSLH